MRGDHFHSVVGSPHSLTDLENHFVAICHCEAAAGSRGSEPCKPWHTREATKRHRTVLHCIVLCYAATVRLCTVLYCTVFDCACCTKSHCGLLSCIALTFAANAMNVSMGTSEQWSTESTPRPEPSSRTWRPATR